MSRCLSSIVAAVAAAAASAFALKFLPLPFAWIGLVWAMAGFVLAAVSPKALRLPIVAISSVPLAIGFSELAAAVIVPPDVAYDHPSMFDDDALLGWRLKPSQALREAARVRGARIYDVTYTTDASGHRISPPDEGRPLDGCVVFFADSFTFGEGVEDRDAFPYEVGLLTHGRYRVVNLAAPGYGAEHMLAMIERGTLATDLPCEPTHIIYAALPHHILRAAGKTDFSRFGPRYRLRADGVPEYIGTNPHQSQVGPGSSIWRRKRVVEQFEKSRIYRLWKKRSARTTQADIDLYFGIVRQAIRLCQQRWPAAEFHVIAWDIHDFYAKGQERFHRGLAELGAHVHCIDDILPGYSTDPQKYGLHRLDLHPSPMADRLVATYLVQHVLADSAMPPSSVP